MASALRRLSKVRNRWILSDPAWVRCASQSASSNQVPYPTMKDEKTSIGQQELPNEADLVVIGGGVAGCALAYYLSKFGVKRVVLLEKHALTSGTTWHTNALIWHLRPNDIDTQLLKRTWDLLDALPKESGVDAGIVQNGGLFIASTKTRMDEYKRLATIGRAFGIESSLLSPEEVKKRYPHLNTDDMYGALYSPTDGLIDAAGYCTGLSRVAMRNGTTIVTDCAVKSIETAPNFHNVPQVTAVETTRGRIKTSQVVVCGGVWSPFILKPFGVHLPVLSVYHSYIVTGAIDDLGQLPNVRDHDGCIAMRILNNTVCLGGYESNPPLAKAEDVKNDPLEDTAFRLSDLKWDSFGSLVDAGIRRLPALKDAGIKNTVCGFEAFTPDHKPLVGPVPGLRGAYVSCAFNSAGIMLSGGCAHELAKWVVHGSPDLDMFASDIRRFNPALTSDTRWVTERSHESYATNYNIVFKNEEPLAGRNRVKDVLYDHLLRDGCIYQERFGWERPAWFVQDGSKAPVLDYDYYGAYGNTRHPDYRYRDFNEQHQTYDFPKFFSSVKAESLSCRRAAALFNVSSIGKFYLVGPDATRAADWLFSNEIAHKTGAVTYSLVLNKRGGIEIDATVCAIGDEKFDLDTELGSDSSSGSGSGGKVNYFVTVDTQYAALFEDTVRREMSAQNLNCHLKNVTNSLCTLSLQGPKSREILHQIAAGLDKRPTQLSHQTLSMSNSEASKFRAVEFSRTGETGWDLHVPTRDAEKLYQLLHLHGNKHGLINAGHYALHSLAIEKGIAYVHSDARSDDTPFEAGLSRMCKLQTDKNFLGRDALVRLAHQKLPKRLLRFTLKRDDLMLNGLESIYRNGKVVGYIRRADFGFQVNRPVAYGYVDAKLLGGELTDNFVLDGKWQLDKMGAMYDAEVQVALGFDQSGKL